MPQHFKPNKALGKWVAKQREQYKLMLKGQHSFLTPYRQEKLNNAGFAWQVRTGLENEVRTVMAEAAVATAPVEDAVVVLAVEAVPELEAQQLEVVDAVDADIHETIMEEETKQHEHEAEV